MARAHRKKPPLSDEQQFRNAQDLETVKLLTEMIRRHQAEINRLAEQRTKVVLYLRGNRVSYRALAESMGTSEQNVYKIVRPHLARRKK